jgi:chorismate dehydratase
MTAVRLGSVTYLNARPFVVGLERDSRFDLRFDIPSRCAALLHEGSIDAGLIPSIEYLRRPTHGVDYRIVPGVAIVSEGPVASVALFSKRAMSDVRSIALDTSSRTSVALTRVLCARAFRIEPEFEPCGPDLSEMLERCDAALLIGDIALLSEGRKDVEKVDLGETWTRTTGLPFVYAFWTGRAGALTAGDVRALQQARDAGASRPDRVARDYFVDPALQGIGARYLRDNIKYELGERERAGLETFYRYAAEIGVVPDAGHLRFYQE